jgi:hypothetical protein
MLPVPCSVPSWNVATTYSNGGGIFIHGTENNVAGARELVFKPCAPGPPYRLAVQHDLGDRCCGVSRDQLIAKLAERGIETRPFFIPLHTLPPIPRGLSATWRRPAYDDAARGVRFESADLQHDD